MTVPQHFRFPADALGLVRIVEEAIGANPPRKIKDALDALAQAFGERDRDLEDWLSRLDLGGAAGPPGPPGAFPLTFNDGTYVYTILEDNAGNITLKVTTVALALQAEVDIGATWGFNVNIPAANASGVSILDHGTGGIAIKETNVASAGAIQIRDLGTGGVAISAVSGGVNLTSSSTGGVNLHDTGTGGANVTSDGGVTVIVNGTTKKLAFYGAAGVTQAAHPVTLADVITLLTNLGLCA